MKGRKTLVVGGVLIWAGGVLASPVNPVLEVHEWGTFTSLQDETGRGVGGINSDDEPLPEFVHSLQEGLIRHSSNGHVAALGGKGVPFVVPSATMRLETPVIYFYPPENARLPLEIDVRVEFRGGWLTQFYPDAIAQAPGLRDGRSAQLNPATVGRLEWRGLKVGGDPRADLPATQSGVWLAPRGVAAATVASRSISRPNVSESEKYLFYRGIANLDAPLKVVREGEKLSIRPSVGIPGPTAAPGIRSLWLTEVREDGLLAFSETTISASARARPDTEIPASFGGEAFSFGNVRRLRESLHRALVESGLFADEAYALLNTWEQSYFRTPGTRLFYLVPQAWTDYHLPLTLSSPAKITRVMIARTEIVTPAQRRLLERMSAGRSHEGRGEAEDSDAFRRLGRFRDALIADQVHRAEPVASGAMSKDDRYRTRERAGNGPTDDDREASPGR